VLALLTGNYQAIYGPGVDLGIHSPKYQEISACIALPISDQINALVLAFNNFFPPTAVGGALSLIVAFNGLIRMAASYSTCQVTLTGTAGTIVTNGQVRDSVPGQGYLWNLPTSVQIGTGGTVTVTATCTIIGAVQAGIGQVNLIATPTSGWTSVTNSAAASPGQPVETDSQLRTRQAISTELPSITMLAGTEAGVAAVSGVTDQLCLENPTNSTLTTWPITSSNPPWFGPAHYITVIVDGGAEQDVADAIYANRGIGCGTNSTTYGSITATTVQVTDPNTGQAFNVSFYYAVDNQVAVTVNAHGLTPAFNAAVQAQIAQAVVNYLNNLEIGATVSWSALFYVAMSQAGNIENPIYDVKTLYVAFGTTPPGSGVLDLNMTYPMQQAASNLTQVAVNSV
jgi:uncharacterized phage protein gp47/JayE